MAGAWEKVELLFNTGKALWEHFFHQFLATRALAWDQCLVAPKGTMYFEEVT